MLGTPLPSCDQHTFLHPHKDGGVDIRGGRLAAAIHDKRHPSYVDRIACSSLLVSQQRSREGYSVAYLPSCWQIFFRGQEFHKHFCAASSGARPLAPSSATRRWPRPGCLAWDGRTRRSVPAHGLAWRQVPRTIAKPSPRAWQSARRSSRSAEIRSRVKTCRLGRGSLRL